MRPVIRYEGTNHRGEPSQPRVDLLALAEILAAAAGALELAGMRLKALGHDAGWRHHQAEADALIALREIRLVRCRRKGRMRWDRGRD
jgi:hypothetical protein